MSDARVLVVGTTPDYVAHIFEYYPKRALFLTDSSHRRLQTGLAPDQASEIVCELANTEEVWAALEKHLRQWNQHLSGVTCYDCEWLYLAARIGRAYDRPFPSVESVQLCRNKYRAKLRWAERGVRCPKTALITTGSQVMRFVDTLKEPVVLKPLTGSGSELTFLCHDRFEASQAFNLIKGGLIQRNKSPLYASPTGQESDSDSRDAMLAEEFIEGREYSADFMIDHDRVTVIRVAKKIRPSNLPFGTTSAYIVPARLPHWLAPEMLVYRLGKAAAALGLARAICMVDFIVSHEEIVFLELTPRIGGDCLPPLVRQCCGLDTIGLALDFAECRDIEIPPAEEWKRLVGMRLFADHSGYIRSLNADRLIEGRGVKEVYLKRKPGHLVVRPPDDYDSWLLGHVIFEPRWDEDFVAHCEELKKLLVVDVEPHYDHKFTVVDNEGGGTAQSADASA